MKFNTVDRKYEKLNDFIRGEMRRKKIKQEDVAYRLNLQQASISQKLNGKVEWTLREIIIVYEMLGIEHEWFN